MTPREARAALWKSRKQTTELTIKDVAEEYGLDPATLFASSTRVGMHAEARREVMVRLYERGFTLSEIGRLVGREASTVQHSVKKALGDQYAKLSPGQGKARLLPVTLADVSEGDAAE